MSWQRKKKEETTAGSRVHDRLYEDMCSPYEYGGPGDACDRFRKQACDAMDYIRRLPRKKRSTSEAMKARDVLRDRMRDLNRCRAKSRERMRLRGVEQEKRKRRGGGVSYSEYTPDPIIIREPYPSGKRRRREVSVDDCSCPNIPGEHDQLVLLKRGKPLSEEVFSNTEDVCRFLWKEGYHRKPQEELTALYLGSDGRLRGRLMVSRGNRSMTLVDVKSVMVGALLMGHQRVILAHNHADLVDPSREDRDSLHRIETAGSLLQIDVLDSVVISSDGSCQSVKDARPVWVPPQDSDDKR